MPRGITANNRATELDDTVARIALVFGEERGWWCAHKLITGGHECLSNYFYSNSNEIRSGASIPSGHVQSLATVAAITGGWPSGRVSRACFDVFRHSASNV